MRIYTLTGPRCWRIYKASSINQSNKPTEPVTSCLALRPPLNIHLQSRLYDEECRVVFDSHLGMGEPESVPPQDLRQDFVHLHDRQVAPNAQMAPTTELLELLAFTRTTIIQAEIGVD